MFASSRIDEQIDDHLVRSLRNMRAHPSQSFARQLDRLNEAATVAAASAGVAVVTATPAVGEMGGAGLSATTGSASPLWALAASAGLAIVVAFTPARPSPTLLSSDPAAWTRDAIVLEETNEPPAPVSATMEKETPDSGRSEAALALEGPPVTRDTGGTQPMAKPRRKRSEPAPHLYRRVVERNRYDIDMCLLVANRQGATDISGPVHFELLIAPSGRVQKVTTRSRDVRNRELLECAKKKVTTWRFRRSREEVIFEFTMKMAPDEAR